MLREPGSYQNGGCPGAKRMWDPGSYQNGGCPGGVFFFLSSCFFFWSIAMSTIPRYCEDFHGHSTSLGKRDSK